jgi:hypothetical protein
MKNAMGLTVILVLIAASVTAQQPHYTVKPLVTINDGTFKDIPPVRKDGKVVSYVQVGTDLFDIDDDNTGSIKISGSALLCFEGAWKNGKKEGLFNVYVIDSLNHKHRYKIWEQQYKNDQLNGEWRNYTLRGTLYRLQTYENGNLKGIAREYDIDGKVMTQREFLGNEREYVDYYFYPNGKLRKLSPSEMAC